jgi:glucose-6-phosphatase
MDHRPFWWVQETNVYSNGPRPLLRQTPLTCETGPGSPSGHMQGASSLMYVVLQHIIHTFIMSSKRMDNSKKRYVVVTLWAVYTLLMILVGVSRLYTATHFPHQTLLGLVAGSITLITHCCMVSKY